MPVPKRVAAINDLSGFGRCSLTAAIPVISAMGVQVARCRRQCSARTRLSHLHLRRLYRHMREYAAGLGQAGRALRTRSTRFLGSAEQRSTLCSTSAAPTPAAAHCRPSWATTAQSTRRMTSDMCACVTPSRGGGLHYAQPDRSVHSARRAVYASRRRARYARICARPVRARPALCRHHGHTPGG